MFLSPTRCPRQQFPPRRTKNDDRSIVFQSREELVVRRGHFRSIGCVIKTLESLLGQFNLGCKCPVRRNIFVQGHDHIAEIPATFFLQNILQLHQQRSVILVVDSSAFWKVINEEDAVLIPKIEARILQRILYSGYFGAGWAAMPSLHWLLPCLRVIVI